MNELFLSIYPLSYPLASALPQGVLPEEFPRYLAEHPDSCQGHHFLPNLAILEQTSHQLATGVLSIPATVEERTVNPTVRMIEVAWAGLPEFLQNQSVQPQQEDGLVLLYQPDSCSPIKICTPDGHDLLALKMVMEGLSSKEVAKEAGVTLGKIDEILLVAVQKGLILTPASSLVRDPSFSQSISADPDTVTTFVLQWHLTQACDLHCRHCYDRSSRKNMEFQQALQVLDELYAFTQIHHVQGQVSLSGGNPMLYPFFYELYQEVVDRGFLVAILGNPMEERYIERLLAIKRPEFYQVSLEGMRQQNDYIRGLGHFDRTLAFLELLRNHSIYSMVMLTLTRANCDEVLALAEHLHGQTDLFTFNRLAMVGEGVGLASVEPERFQTFLKEFLLAADHHDHVTLKDSLFNLILEEQGRSLTGGCTGFGCGAAFNFVSVLPDGEVHACRKFPSPIGNIFSQSLIDIYAGEPAKRYRKGSTSCSDCTLHSACRGCPAVAHGFGLDVFTQRDPYCFKADPQNQQEYHPHERA